MALDQGTTSSRAIIFDEHQNLCLIHISNMSQFRCDVQDKGDSYLLEAELPGFEREDIGIDLDGTTLVITARHSSESGEKDKDGNYLRRERKFGSFSRSFDVSGVDTEQDVYKRQAGHRSAAGVPAGGRGRNAAVCGTRSHAVRAVKGERHICGL